MANNLKDLKGFFQFNKNDTLTNILIFLILAITIGYLTQKRYEAIIFLYVIAILLFFLTKNVALSLGLSIVFTNLLISLNFFQLTENFEGSIDDVEAKEIAKMEATETTKPKKENFKGKKKVKKE